MKISKTLVLGTLLSATLGGGLAIAQPGGGWGGRGGKEMGARRMERMKTALNLSAQQMTQLSKIMDDNRKEMDALRKKNEARINGILNADQKKKLAEMKARGPQGGMGRGR